MEEELRQQCRHGVRQVLAQRGWQLVRDEPAFVEEVVTEVQARLQSSRRPLKKIIEDATVNRYCHLWHAACGADGALRQRQAFKELYCYLYPIALYRAKHDQHIAEESTQEALIKVWQHLDQVRDPGCFARWASRIVLRVVSIIEERHLVEASEVDLPHPSAPETVEEPLTRAANQAGLTTSPPEPESTSEMRTQLTEAIEQCLRSRQQQVVITGLFFDQKGYKELADELRTSVENIYVLKSRALDRLRECGKLLEALLAALED